MADLLAQLWTPETAAGLIIGFALLVCVYVIDGLLNAPDRTTWIYCPCCNRDLNGDFKSIICSGETRTTYRCDTCTTWSHWHVHPPKGTLLEEWPKTIHLDSDNDYIACESGYVMICPQCVGAGHIPTPAHPNPRCCNHHVPKWVTQPARTIYEEIKDD